MSDGVFNFNFLALVFSEILGVPKFTLGSPTPPGRPLAEKFFYIQRVLHNTNCVFNFNILHIVVSEILGGLIFKLGELCPLVRPLAENFFVPEASTLLCLMAFLISTF